MAKKEGQMEMNEQDLEQIARESEKSTMQQLKDMEQVNIHIPIDQANEEDQVVPIGFNGVVWFVKRGEDVQVPKVIADIWRDSYERTRQVEKRMNSTDKEMK